MELTRKEIERAIDTPAAITDPGTELPFFEPVALARGLEQEIAKAEARELTHIRLNMPLADIAALASFLRRGALSGV